jgi:hypothetical protein
MGGTGLEHNAKSPEKLLGTDHSAAESGAVSISEGIGVPSGLQEIIDAWPTLPAPITAGILAMVRASNVRKRNNK